MKTFSLLIALVLKAALCVTVSAQEIAPSSLAGKSAVVVISSGGGSFAAIGGYRIAFSLTNLTYTVSPLSTTVLPSAGTYSYAKLTAQTARITLTDPRVGSTIAQNLIFSSSSSATYSISSTLGVQAGTLVFENPPVAASSRYGFLNMSTRAQVPAGAEVISGLVIDCSCRVLIRVAGPALAAFGVNGTLPNPKLSLILGKTAVTANDDWASTISGFDAVSEAGAKAGAFPFMFGSKDAALVADLSAGNYTCVITGDLGTSGEVLLEVYRVPQ